MFTRSQPGKLTSTLIICIVLALTLSACSDAKATQHRDHVNLKRLIRKRQLPDLIPVAGAAAPPPAFTTTTSSSTGPATPSGSSTSPAVLPTSSTTDPSGTSTTATSDSTSTTQVSSSTSTQSSTTSSSSTSEAINVTSPPTTVSSLSAKPTVTRTESVDPTGSSTAVPIAQSNSSKTRSTTLTVVIIVGSSIAGVAILWTVFRKWKLARSSKFDARLQPIDWHPTADVAAPHRLSTASSNFHSGLGRSVDGHTGSDNGHGTSDRGHLHGLPDHDFTAGPSTLAPVGGYADLARGSSPQPQMHQMGYSPSLSRPTYDAGVPLHHQAGYHF